MTDAKRITEDVGFRNALRLTFAFRGTRVQLLFEEPVEMIVHPSSDIQEEQPLDPFRIEAGVAQSLEPQDSCR
jgi:hypothetical protein